MKKFYDIAIIGLSLSSSWGNGHATTYRALIRGLAEQGVKVLFLERDVPWYAENRDLPDPDFCDLRLYRDLQELDHHRAAIQAADIAIVGSFVPDGRAVIDRVAGWKPRLFAFYDIDTPVTLATLSRGEDEHLAARQMADFDLYLSFSGGDVLDRLEAEFGARRAHAFYCSVDEHFYRPVDAEQRWDLGYLGTYSPDRQPMLDRLLLEPARRLPDRQFVVAGSRFPDDMDWPSNVERIEHLPPSEHPDFYSRQKYTLNVTRADMIAAGWSPSVRLFEAAACGTPIISDRWRGLTDLFPENEAITIADTTEDVVALLSQENEEARQLRAKRARAIVRGGHTGRARASQLSQIVAQHTREASQSAHKMDEHV